MYKGEVSSTLKPLWHWLLRASASNLLKWPMKTQRKLVLLENCVIILSVVIITSTYV